MVSKASLMLIGALFCGSSIAADQFNGMEINVISNGTAVDAAAVSTARQYVGRAIANGVVDSFHMIAPRRGGPVPIEGGFSACAEKGFLSTDQRFLSLSNRLKAIRSRPGTTVSVTLVAECGSRDTPHQVCGGITGLACSGGESCVDDPTDNCDPKNGGADCSGICQPTNVVCTLDAKQCPDGSFVSRVPPNCEFAACPSNDR